MTLLTRAALAAVLLAVACTSGPRSVLSTTSPQVAEESPSVAVRAAFSPRNARLVGTIRAPKPSADDVTLFKPIILAAYKLACPSVLDVQSEIRTAGPNTFIVVRCGDHAARAVKVRMVYTGVRVPNLVGADAHSLSTLGAMLGLRIEATDRPRRVGEESNTIVEQRPAAGVVVPFGTTLTVVVAS